MTMPWRGFFAGDDFSGAVNRAGSIGGLFVVAVFLMCAFSAPVHAAQGADEKPAYLDASLPVAVRVDDLMRRMTLKEKIGQLNLPCVYVTSWARRWMKRQRRCASSPREPIPVRSDRERASLRWPIRCGRKTSRGR